MICHIPGHQLLKRHIMDVVARVTGCTQPDALEVVLIAMSMIAMSTMTSPATTLTPRAPRQGRKMCSSFNVVLTQPF